MPGGSGHVGQSLRRHLQPLGWTFTVLSRHPNGPDEVLWDGRSLGPWVQAIEGAGVLINLAGRTVNCRYTKENLRQMMESRIDSTRALSEAVAGAVNPPRVWLQSSTATIYAHRLDGANDEISGILGGDEAGAPYKWNASIAIAKAWEEELERAPTPRTRKLAMRSAMTMSVDQGSVFDVFARLALRGLGGRMGSGRQYVSWVHEDDFARAVQFLAERDDLSGPLNICSPNPLPNEAFMRVLREAVGSKFGPPVPAWALEVGALLRGTETELILKSRRVVPGRLLEAGFEFRFPEWSEAAAELAGRWGMSPRRGDP